MSKERKPEPSLADIARKIDELTRPPAKREPLKIPLDFDHSLALAMKVRPLPKGEKAKPRTRKKK